MKPVDARLPTRTFDVFGYVHPKDVEAIRAWYHLPGRPRERVHGHPMTAPAPFDWAFCFEQVPPKQFLKVIVQAKDAYGNVGRDETHVIVVPMIERLTVTISSPTNNQPVTRMFCADGWVNNSQAALSAEIRRGVEVVPATITRNYNPSPFVDWLFDIVVAANVDPGAATLVVTARFEGFEDKDQRDIQIIDADDDSIIP